ncbi:FAD-dependent oxidoreductase [Streptomyces sp. NPDC002018]|uniref:FAD-dependent oxidoreductase n=1 Tax=Streptomyces sp. NPDC002018 TaxID=3364629 RepID=UPI0036CEBAF1
MNDRTTHIATDVGQGGVTTDVGRGGVTTDVGRGGVTTDVGRGGVTTDVGRGGERRHDVVVVGGGAAGLSGALTLARARRSVLVIDAGRPRNAPASQVHTYLAHEGTPPSRLLATGREEVTGYGGEITEGEVVTAGRLEDGGFRVVLADGSAVTARRLLVTTGLVDELPPVPGLAERWGREVLHCPYCHGWEVRDQPVGVLSTGPMAVHQALLWRQWSGDVTLFRHTGPEPDDEEYERLAARGVTVVDGEVSGLEITDGRFTGVTVAGAEGRVFPCRALVVAPRFTARAGLLTGLGLEAAEREMDGHVIGSHVVSDPSGATEVPGVWVAGNVTDLAETVIGSAAAAVRAAAAINADLIAEETREAVAARRDPRKHGAPLGTSHAPPRASRAPLRTSRESDEERGMTTMTGHSTPDERHSSHGTHRSPEDFTSSEEYWDDLYGQSEQRWSGRPNTVLVREVAGLAPGHALDLGCGEGADAVWLARQGWRVTGTDISGVALGRAADHAEAEGVADRIDWQRHELGVSFPEGRFDLVSAHFLHSYGDLPREKILRTAASAVAPGGVLLIVGHAGFASWEENPHTGVHFPTPEEVLASLDLADGEWEVRICEEYERQQDGPAGQPGHRRDNILKVRRLTDRAAN